MLREGFQEAPLEPVMHRAVRPPVRKDEVPAQLPQVILRRVQRHRRVRDEVREPRGLHGHVAPAPLAERGGQLALPPGDLPRKRPRLLELLFAELPDRVGVLLRYPVKGRVVQQVHVDIVSVRGRSGLVLDPEIRVHGVRGDGTVVELVEAPQRLREQADRGIGDVDVPAVAPSQENRGEREGQNQHNPKRPFAHQSPSYRLS